jgi:hypothetical protein
MKARFLIILGVLTLCLTVGVAYAVNSFTSQHQTDANVLPTPSPSPVVGFTETLNGTSINLNSDLHFNNVMPGNTYTSTLAIHNIGNVPLTITLTVTGLPSGWTLTYDKSATVVAAGATTTGNLVLTIPVNAVIGLSSWATTLTGTP